MKEDFPGAVIRASTWDEFTSLLIPLADTLPLIEEEMGDTWIYGIASGTFCLLGSSAHMFQIPSKLPRGALSCELELHAWQREYATPVGAFGKT